MSDFGVVSSLNYRNASEGHSTGRIKQVSAALGFDPPFDSVAHFFYQGGVLVLVHQSELLRNRGIL
jgi:hypothetical protein